MDVRDRQVRGCLQANEKETLASLSSTEVAALPAPQGGRGGCAHGQAERRGAGLPAQAVGLCALIAPRAVLEVRTSDVAGPVP